MSPPPAKENEVPIAIVGLSCRFPGDASTPSRFWDLLKNGKSGYSNTTDRYNAKAFVHPQKEGTRQNVVPTEGGYFLKENPYVFDAAFFNITATEAISFDPRQRITMEVAFEALENAGITLADIRGTQTACFMGTSMSDYRDAVSRDFQNYPKYHILGVSDEMIANRVSHFLDIHGPSATVQSACSSSLVATHVACQSLRTGEADMAIAGGVGLVLGTEGTMHLTNLGFLNPEGHSRSFDKDAGGYGRGEGCGVLIMKRLDQAIQDGDNIRAVIRASGVNSDGWTQGVTFPSYDAQAALIKQIYEANNLDYSATQYVEAHGTGTKAGDPIETRAIANTIGQGKSRKQLYVGSVKPNIGHLEAAAGVASIVKGVLALENGQIPPVVNFNTPNPNIPLDEWKMTIPTKLTPWPAAKTKRMSISGFGMGGTNGHIVMEAYKPQATLTNGTSAPAQDTKRIFPFSSHDKAGLKRVGQALDDYLENVGAVASSATYLANLAYTLGKARSGLGWRDTVMAESLTELREQITSKLGEDATRTPTSAPRLGFVFTGQGAQWARMGIELLERPVFAASVAKSAKILKEELGCEWDPVEELSKEGKESQLGVPKLSQPMCSVLQIALVDELRSWGVTPSKVCGHSSGEIAAAYTMGALCHKDAIAAAYYRGTHSSGPKMKRHNGGMMAVGCSRDDAKEYMNQFGVKATVACVNSPSSVTISGDVPELDKLKAKLDEQEVFARRLKVDVAYHSNHMHGCSMDYYSDIAEVGPPTGEEEGEYFPKHPITMVSSVSGVATSADDLGPYYWVQNLISPVLFTDALKELVAPADRDGEKDVDMLVEIGPHSALGGPIEQILSEAGVTNVKYTSMLTRNTSALETSMNLAVELFTSGVNVDIGRANGDESCKLLIDLPPYAWNHSEEFRADGRLQREQYSQKFPTMSLLGAQHPNLDANERIWRNFINLDDEPWLRGHKVGDTILFPGAGMVSITLEAVRQIADQHKTPTSFKFRDIAFVAAMPLAEKTPTEVIVALRPQLLGTAGSTKSGWYEFTVSSSSGPTVQLRNNCRGLVSIVYDDDKSAAMKEEQEIAADAHITEYRHILEEYPEICEKEGYYDQFTLTGMNYSDTWQGVENCHPGQGKAVFDVKVHDLGDTFTKGKLDRPFLIHPAALDAAWQGYMGSTVCSIKGGFFAVEHAMVPTSVGELEISADIPGDVGTLIPSVCRSHSHGFNEISADVTMFDADLNKVVMSTVDYRLSPLDSGDEDSGDNTVDIAEITSDIRWEYSLDLLTTREIGQALAKATNSATANDKLLRLAQIVVHQQPTVSIVELVETSDKVGSSVASKLPKGAVHDTQVHYAVMDADSNSPPKAADGVFGTPFVLPAADAAASDDSLSAGLILVPHEINANTKHGLDDTLERLLKIANPGGIAAIAAPVGGSLEAILKSKGFDIIFSMSAGADAVTLCRHDASGNKAVSETPAEGDKKEVVTILESSEPSSEAQTFSKGLQEALTDEGYQVETKSDTASDVGDNLHISLLELDKPYLEDVSESAYKSIQKLIVGCKRLLWITAGDHPSFGVIDGLINAVNVESGEPKLQVLHLTRDGQQAGPGLITRILQTPEVTTENELRERGGLLQVPRLYRGLEENQHVRDHLHDSVQQKSLNEDKDTLYRLAIGKQGMLDTLHFVEDQKTAEAPLGDNELELEVKATGVNFRDIMTCMGLVASKGLGVEGSGIVRRVGINAVGDFQIGDRVATLSMGGAHATKTRCDHRVTTKLPEGMTFEEAAAAATVHAAANFTLNRLAKLQKGQSVLIHAAAGGLGQAAVQLAQKLGLTIYATVSTDDKRKILTEHYGVLDEHIFNSRDSSFAQGVLRCTDGKGVDCVLNSLSGELLRVSWNCLATFGTFIEVGTRDITENMGLDMRPFERMTTFSSFDIPTTIANNPAMLGEALRDAFDLLGKGDLRVPFPLTVYPAGQAENALRAVQQGRHRGKIVLSFSEESKESAPVLCKAKDALKLDSNATYLFIGGLGGLGRSLSKEMVQSGARHLAFLSRSGDAKPEAKETVEQLTNLGAKVTVLKGDVSDEESFLAAMKQCSSLPTIKGVIQMAMVLRDGPFENMSYEDWLIPTRPKIQGTWNLHTYFNENRPLDFMIFCSSLSGVCGSAGQAQYGAGNTYQDSLAHARREAGLRAVSVNLGLMLDVGILHEMGDHSYKQYEESLGIRESAFHALIKSIINGQQDKRPGDSKIPAQIATGFGTADIIAAHGLPMPPWMNDIRFGPLAVPSTAAAASATGKGGAGASLSQQLTDAGAAKDFSTATTVIEGALVDKLAEILRIPATEIDPSRALYTYGVDSLVALEVRNWVTRETKASVQLLDILAAVPVTEFAGGIAKKSKFMEG